jgi:hypothetical protein
VVGGCIGVNNFISVYSLWWSTIRRTSRTNGISYMLEGHTHESPPDMFHTAPGLSRVKQALRPKRQLWCFP